jgi:hypothetical protein
MLEDPSSTYQNKSTSYGRVLTAGRTTGTRSNGLAMNELSLPVGAETLSATSTITIAGLNPSCCDLDKPLAVPESLVGQILGKKGTTIREIQQLSGAKVVVSARSPDDPSNIDIRFSRHL